MMRETEVAIAAAKEAGKIAMRYFGKEIKAETKDDSTPVTAVDRLCEKKIISIIKRNFPEHSVLSEESGEIKGNEYRWIIDPLDGTKYFIRGLPVFGTLIALERDGEIICGAAHMPALGRLNFAEKGRGSFTSNKRIKVSKTNNIGKSVVLYSSLKHFANNNLRNLITIIRSAGMSLSPGVLYAFMLVAEGIADAVISARAEPWDVATVKIIVEEAGGKMTDFRGNDTIYGGNAVVTNGLLHDKILSILRR